MMIKKSKIMFLIAEAMDMTLVDLYKDPAEFREALILYLENMKGMKDGAIIPPGSDTYNFVDVIIKSASGRDDRRLRNRIDLINKDDLISPARKEQKIQKFISKKSRFFAALPFKIQGKDESGRPIYIFSK